MFKKINCCAWALVAMTAAVTLSAQAGVVISGTRVIYPEGNKEVSVRLTNAGSDPALVQAWVDDGRENATPNDLSVPFVLTPPVARIEPGKGQTLRLMFTGADLPKDKESVFWFNALEIPPKPVNADSRNLMQFAFRTRIKLFYRPSGLTGNPIENIKQVTWSLAPAANGKGLRVRANNPSPYFVSFGELSVIEGGKSIALEPGMIPPKGTADFQPVKGELRVSAKAQVDYASINDYGGIAKGTSPLQ
jgi:chaperone protein EcpD